MAWLRLTLFATLAIAATPAAAEPVDQWQSHIAEASLRFGIPEEWIRRVMGAESGGRTHRHGKPIRSSAGAMGLMQLMPATWADMRRSLGLGRDPDDPRDNILAGAAYLRMMYDRFGYPGLFAAYNAGPGRYAGYLSTGRPLASETIDYVRKLALPTGAGRSPTSAPTSSPLFAIDRRQTLRQAAAANGGNGWKADISRKAICSGETASLDPRTPPRPLPAPRTASGRLDPSR